jgi:ribosome-binding ATPase YchF (GTP1/OBG family)
MGALTIKPAVWLANVGEDENGTMGWEARLRSVVPSGDEVVAASALLEEEAAQVDSEARAELLSGLGLGAGVLARVVGAAYASLGLISFYTLGPKEARAWTVRRGATASEAAGKIHTDLERGFIRAEVCTLEHAISAGGFEAAKKAGMVRVEGKAYEVAEGDVLLIRFSV